MNSSVQSGLLDEQLSLFAIATVLLRAWRRIARWALVGALIALVIVFDRPRVYPATLAFVPQSSDATRSGLASLAGQFGIMPALGPASQQPDFYLTLVDSRELLVPILLDTFQVQEEGGRRATLLELFEVKGATPAHRLDNGLKKLRSRLGKSIVKNAGVVRVTVRTEWPSVSLRVSERLFEGINEYNLRTRQGQASAERRFVESRLAVARDSLRVAEDRLQEFLTRNKGGVTSPHLNSALQRLERELSARTAIVTGLTQEHEEVRIREVRDTPTITVFERPAVSPVPESRGRVLSVLFGLMFGAGVGVALALAGAIVARRRAIADPEVNEFFGVLGESRQAIRRRLPFPRSSEV